MYGESNPFQSKAVNTPLLPLPSIARNFAPRRKPKDEKRKVAYYTHDESHLSPIVFQIGTI